MDASVEPAAKAEVIKKRPLLAAILTALSAVFFTTQYLGSKVLYMVYPSTTPFQLLFFRAVGALVILGP